MIRTWKCLLGTVAVCALLAGESGAQEIRSNQVGVARLRPDPLNDTQSADWLYGKEESVWLDDFQPPPGIGVDPVTVPLDNSVGYAVTSSVDDILYRINRTTRHYYGLDDGFTSAHAFIPVRVMNGGTSLLAVDPRVFVNDSGRGGLNVGVTARRYFPSSDRVLSTSFWLDYEEAHRGSYAQIGFFGAIIGRYLTTSAFANIPVGESGEMFARTTTASFVGNNLALAHKAFIESPYAHYQVEVSTPIPYFSKFGFEYGVGGYALASRYDGLEDGFGISNRIEAQVTEDLTVNTLVTSDGVFGSNLSVNMELTLPNGMPSRILRHKPVVAKLRDSDRRSYRVLTNVICNRTYSTAIDPKDGQPITVAHINPNLLGGVGGGTGVNDPFGSVFQFESLPDVQQSSYDIIFVQRRVDDTDMNLNTTITLFDCQQLLGEGVPHFVNTTTGPVLLPGFNPGPTPQLTNSGAPGMDVVTLADENVVSGFTIDASAGTGDSMHPDAAMAINGLDAAPFDVGDPGGVRDFVIDRNVIQNATYGMMIVSEPAGMTTGVITNNEIGAVAQDAINLNFNGSITAMLTIEDNLISPSAGAALIGLGFFLDGNTFGQPYFITNNSAAGFDITGFTLDLAPTVVLNPPGVIWDTIEPGASIPFLPLMASDVLTGLASINGTAVVPPIAPGPGATDTTDSVGTVLAGGGVPDDQSIIDLTFNDFNPTETFTWEIDSDFIGIPGSTVLGSDLIGSDITVNFTGGLFLTGALMPVIGNPDASEFIATGGNAGLPVGRDGIHIDVSDTAVILPGSSIARNQIENVGRDGIRINGPGMAMVTLDISDNMIVGAGGNGMTFITTDMETMTIDGDRNFVNMNTGDGLHMETFDSSTMSVTFRNSTFDNNGDRGIKGASFDTSSLTFSLTSPFDPLLDEDLNMNGLLDPFEDVNMNGMLDDFRSSASNNGGPGIDFAATDTAMQSILIDQAIVDNNVDAGILVGASGDNGFMMGSIVDVTITNSDITNTMDGADPDLNGDGIVLRTSGFGTLTSLIMDNNMTIDGNAGHGIFISSSENSVLDMTTASGFGIVSNTITNNGLEGINIERRGSAMVDVDIIDNLIDMNGSGISVFTDGANIGVPGSSGTNILIMGNEVTNSTTGDGMNFNSNGASGLFVAAIDNLISGHADNGVQVTANDGSFFGISPIVPGDIGLPSIFDSNWVLNNGDAGFLLENAAATAPDQLATLVVDITSDFSVGDPDIDVTRIAGNVDGIRVEHNGQNSVGPDALTSIRVGNAFNPFPDVIIEENTDDAVDIDINPASGGIFNFNISNSLLRGARALGALTDPGIEIDHDSSFTVANIVVGADISDSPLRGPVRNPFTGPRAGVIITDFADDGVTVVYQNSDSTGSALNLRFFDSVIGQSAFGFNAGDGIDILVDNAGDSIAFGGLDVVIDNTDVIGNGGDGVRLRTVARTGGLFTDPFGALDGARVFVGPGSQTDSNNNGIGDTVFDGAIMGDTTSDLFLNSLLFVLDPIGNDNGWADLTSPDDFIADLQIINGSRIDNNGGAGVNLEIGTATRQRVSMQNSSFSGNGSFEIDIETFASFEVQQADIDRAEGMIDEVILDPTAKLDIYLGTLTFGPGPEPGPTPLPGSFAAPVGGEGPNFGSSNRFSLDYVSTTAEGFQTASIFKGAPRPANLFVRALVPDDDFPVDDMDFLGPPPNMFLDNGMPFDEIFWFTGSLPPTNFPPISGRWLDINTP